MLKNILKGEDCASCRICCVFDKYDLWETPVLEDGLKAKVSEEFPGISFVQKGNGWLFRMEESEDGLYYCPMLDPKSGCMLGDGKPFDCRIWPYRVMELGGCRVISMASICPTMYAKPLSELCGELEKNSLAEKILAYADSHPDIVKPYESGYPILKAEPLPTPPSIARNRSNLSSR